jgi:hypothetical protein
MIPRVETLKILHNLDNMNYNHDLDCIQFTDREDKKTLLVIANENGKSGSINTTMARKLKDFLDVTEFESIFIFSEVQTESAYNLLKYHEKATLYTSNSRIQLRTDEILEALKLYAGTMCELECGVNPVEKTDCKATLKGAETCTIRTHIDNAEFHAKMGWKDQLLQGFLTLIEHKQELIEERQEAVTESTDS